MTRAGAGMNVDLSADGASTIIFVINGDMDDSIPARTLPLTIEVIGSGVTGYSTQTDGSDGIHIFSFADFGGVDFTSVTSISMTIIADENLNDAMDFSIADLQSGNENTVATEGSTWDNLKSLYR